MQKLSQGSKNLGIFRKRVGIRNFVKIFFKILIGLSPICCVCICVGPVWHSNLVLRFTYVHALFICVMLCCMLSV